MNSRVLWVVFCMLILLAQSTFAATIHGTVYDLSLEQVKNVIVEIDTQPAQRMVAKDGSYSFEVPAGMYVISAKQVSNNITLATSEENIEVSSDGDYVLDLFLFPVFEEEELYEEPDVDLSNIDYKTTNTLLILVAVLLILLIVIIVILWLKPKKTAKHIIEGDDDLEKVMSIIKSHGGRTTQKEIRKHFPMSEAKVSLILTELEDKGLIKKIKKGRGNIIILNR